MLEDNIYLKREHNPRARLVEMFHGGTPESVKKHIVMQFSDVNSCLRVLICTVAFGMGVNCRNINESIHFGAPKNIECYVQESGRIGRDGTVSVSRILYSAKLLKGAEHQIVNFIKGSTCRRQELMKKFDSYQEKNFSGCKCCDNCAKLCNCSDICCDWITIQKSYNPKEFSCISGHNKKRTVSEEQKNGLHKLLQEYRKKLIMDKRLSLSSVHNEFDSFHINQVLSNCEYLFTIHDINNCVEIWRKIYAGDILTIINIVFHDILLEDMPSIDETRLNESMASSVPDNCFSINDSDSYACDLWDSEMQQSFESISDCSHNSNEQHESSLDASEQSFD